MIEDALRYLASMATDAAKPQELDAGNPRLKTFVCGVDRIDLPVPPAPRDHALGTLHDLLAFAEKHASPEGSAIYFNPGYVRLVLDHDAHRVERATLALTPSDQWKTLKALEGGKPLDHKPFLRLLRIDLSGTMPPGVLYDRVKRVAFDNGSIVTADVSRNKAESMGRSITAKVSGEGEIPEEVTLEVPVYSTPGETARYAVRCSVEVDPGSGRFTLAPLPDELTRVQALALASIRERLAQGTKIPAYLGAP